MTSLKKCDMVQVPDFEQLSTVKTLLIIHNFQIVFLWTHLVNDLIHLFIF